MSEHHRLLFQRGLRTWKSNTRSTLSGEMVERHYKEFQAFAAIGPKHKTDKALKWWEKGQWSALIGVGLLAAAVALGGWLARLA